MVGFYTILLHPYLLWMELCRHCHDNVLSFLVTRSPTSFFSLSLLCQNEFDVLALGDAFSYVTDTRIEAWKSGSSVHMCGCGLHCDRCLGGLVCSWRIASFLILWALPSVIGMVRHSYWLIFIQARNYLSYSISGFASFDVLLFPLYLLA